MRETTRHPAPSGQPRCGRPVTGSDSPRGLTFAGRDFGRPKFAVLVPAAARPATGFVCSGVAVTGAGPPHCLVDDALRDERQFDVLRLADLA